MSELKEHLFVPYSELQEGDELTDAITIAKSYYLKSEADKVIARQKYKRCLAMARIAQDDWHLHNSFYAMGHREFEKRKYEFYEKWRERWLKIAEQFKEAK